MIIALTKSFWFVLTVNYVPRAGLSGFPFEPATLRYLLPGGADGSAYSQPLQPEALGLLPTRLSYRGTTG